MVHCLGLNYTNNNGMLVLQDIRELSEIELSNYFKNSKIINQYINLNNAIYLLMSNYEEFSNFISNPENYLIHNGLEDKMNKLLINANKYLTNLLFSLSATKNHFKLLLDINDQKLFEDKMNYLYSNNDEYTFIWELRNYAQHFFLPLTNIQISEHLDGEQISKSIEFKISKKELLINKSNWKRITDFVNQQPEYIDIKEKLSNVYYQIINIYKAFSNNHIEKFDTAFKDMSKFVKEIQVYAIDNKINNFYPCILQLEMNMSFQMKHLYLDTLYNLGYFEKEFFI